jgi:uncharacterized protein DUF3987/DnaB helicase-like protein
VTDSTEIPPHNLDAENAVLGAILLEGRATLPRVVDVVQALDFYTERHRTVYEAMLRLFNRGDPVDVITLTEELRRSGQLEAVGGPAALALLVEQASIAPNLDGYSRIVREYADRRRLLQHATLVSTLAYEGTRPEELERVMSAGLETLRKSNAWQPPIPFAAPTLPQFPMHALPPVIADLVTTVAATHKVPVDMIAGACLAAVAGASARRVEVQIGATFRQPVNLYVAIVAESGERKGPVFRAALRPLELIERELKRSALPEIEAARERRRLAEARLKHLRDLAAKAKADEHRKEAAQEAEEMARALPAIPPEPKIIVGNITPERLEQELADQGVVMLASEEAGSPFEIAAGRYASDGGEQLDALLMAYDGGAIRTGRITRADVAAASPALTILLMPQPTILERFRNYPAFEERGLIGRFAFLVPAGLAGTRLFENRAIAGRASTDYEAMINRIWSLPRPADPEAIPALRIEDDALEVWTGAHNAIERGLGEGGALYHIRAWAKKHPSRVARIAGLLHLVTSSGCTPWAMPINVDTVKKAVEIGDYMLEHAKAAYSIMRDPPEVALARKLLRWIERRRLIEFTLRDCHQHHRWVGSPHELLPGLRILEGRGFIRTKPARERHDPGREPGQAWAVNPLWHVTKFTKSFGQADFVNSVKRVPGLEDEVPTHPGSVSGADPWTHATPPNGLGAEPDDDRERYEW